MHDPVISEILPPSERIGRDALSSHANGYFDTLQQNDGEIRGTCFHDAATRRENGLLFADIGGGFRSGRYAFNNRVRREIVLVDEARQVAMARGFIDHKGVLDEYLLTDGTKAKSVFQEPQSWGLLEAFKVTGRLHRRGRGDVLPGSLLPALAVDGGTGPVMQVKGER